MKILLIQDFLRNGGTERQTLLLAQGFAARGQAVHLLTFRPGGALASRLQGLPHRSLQGRDLGLNWWAPGLHRVARTLAPDVVLLMGRMAHCHGTGLRRALPAATLVATLRTGKPLPWLFRRTLHHAHHVVANSEEAASHLTNAIAVPAPRVSVIPNALVFPATAPTPSPDDQRQRHGVTPATTVLLSVAMFRPEKGQSALIDLVAGLPPNPPWQLWLAGDGPTLPACQAQVARLGLGDRVIFHGFLADPTPLYHQADLAVLASRSESLSNFLIEAQAHGLPAVAYAARGVGETFLPDETGLLVAPGDAATFRAALTRLIRDPVRRAAMGEAAARRARERFAPERAIEAHLDLFARLRQPASS
jgi:glycosyltransferase involved in cell wall biosynthesis